MITRLAIILLFSASAYAQTVAIVGSPNVLADGCAPLWNSAAKQFICDIPSGGGVPAGSTILIASGTCPTGFSEVAGLDGVTLVGTLAAHGDVGTTGGSDTLTPTGTVSQPTFSGNSVGSSLVSGGTPAGTNSTSTVTPLGTNSTSTAAAQVFTGTPSTVVVNHVHLQTAPTGQTGGQDSFTRDASTNGSSNTALSTANPTGGAASYTPAGTNGTSSVTAQAFTGSSSVVSAQVFTGSALGTHQHATTATGTVSQPTFTGDAGENRSAFLRVIFCSKD